MRLDGWPEVRSPGGRWIGLGGVLALHALLGWGLWAGLSRTPPQPKLQRIPFAVITETPVPPAVERTAPSPAPKPTPAVSPPRPTPSDRTPKPVQPPTPPVSPTAAPRPPEPRPTSVRQATPAETAPPVPTPAAPQPAAAPAATPTADKAPSANEGSRSATATPEGGAVRAPAGPVRAEVGILCPGYKEQLDADLSGLVERYGIEGDVRVQIVVRGDEIEEVRTVSGPREYHAAVRSAVRRFRCRVTGSDTPRTATLTVSFRQD